MDFLPCSYGYRPGRSARAAVRDLTRELQFGVYGYVVEVDIRGFFEHIDHEKSRIVRFSRFHLGKRSESFEFLGFEFRWMLDRSGTPRVRRRTARATTE